jgi:arabinan endo-1,5-alpha-L-arabinosidase
LRTVILLFFAVFSSQFVVAQQSGINNSVHDPVIIRQDSIYYIFSTGRGISVWSSTDMHTWKKEMPVFNLPPQWAVDIIPGFKGHIWAPDISYFNGLFYLYYSVSVFGKNTSAIGLATNPTLHPDDSNFHWTDHGKIIQSVPGKTNWNAIDPNLIVDDDGTPYLVFGSFWDGIKLGKLSADGFTLAEDPGHLSTIATRKRPDADGIIQKSGANPIEGPFIFKHQGYYYLFASIDYCCKGPQSTYKMIVARSKRLKGPYYDKEGIDTNLGGGTILLQGDANWYGVGHNAVATFNGLDYIVFHGYDANDKGISKLRIEKLNWNKGWPIVATAQSNNQ